MTCLKSKIRRDKINVHVIDMSDSDYQGMNYYANKELRTGYKMCKNDVLVSKDLNKSEKRDTIRHELVERKLMKQGMKYRKADSIAQKYG